MPKLTACLIDITRNTLEIEGTDVTRDARFAEDLGADSLDCVELMMALEEEFEIEFPDEAMSDLTTIGAVADYLRIRAADKPAVMSLTAA